MTTLKFTKMQGLGNDFVVLDGIRQRVELSAAQVRLLADRRFGVGCDQVLLVEARDAATRISVTGYSTRTAARSSSAATARAALSMFVRDRGSRANASCAWRPPADSSCPRLEDDGQVTVDMGVPRFAPEDVPFTGGKGAVDETLDVDGVAVRMSVLSMGNPHAVQQVADVDAAPVATQGPRIENHPRFPRRVNAGYMQVVDRATIRLRVWERGAGETLACGTGACAAVVAGIRRGLLDSPVRVQTRGGELAIAWAGDGQPVRMTGPAVDGVRRGVDRALDARPRMSARTTRDRKAVNERK